MRDFRWSFIIAAIVVTIVAIQTISCNESVEEAATASLSVLKAPSYFEFDKSAPALSESRLNDLFLSISGFPIDQVNQVLILCQVICQVIFHIFIFNLNLFWNRNSTGKVSIRKSRSRIRVPRSCLSVRRRLKSNQTLISNCKM